MKILTSFLVTAILTFVLSSQVQAQTIPAFVNCYDSGAVDQDAPYLALTSKLSNRKIKKLKKILFNQGLLKINSIVRFTDSTIINLSVDDSQFMFPLSINIDRSAIVDPVATQVLLTALNEIGLELNQVILQCNNSMKPYPKAGGVN